MRPGAGKASVSYLSPFGPQHNNALIEQLKAAVSSFDVAEAWGGREQHVDSVIREIRTTTSNYPTKIDILGRKTLVGVQTEEAAISTSWSVWPGLEA